MTSNTNSEKYHPYKDPENYQSPSGKPQRVGKGSKTDTYNRWKQDGILNDKLLLMEGYARDGATELQVAEGLEIALNTLRNMKAEYKDVADALRKGKEIVDYAVENALLRKALSGDVQAQTFWLKNRKPSQWRDLKEINANLQDGFVNIDLTGIFAKVGENGHLETVNTNSGETEKSVKVE